MALLSLAIIHTAELGRLLRQRLSRRRMTHSHQLNRSAENRAALPAVLAKQKHMVRLQTRSGESRGGPGKCQEIGYSHPRQ